MDETASSNRDQQLRELEESMKLQFQEFEQKMASQFDAFAREFRSEFRSLRASVSALFALPERLEADGEHPPPLVPDIESDNGENPASDGVGDGTLVRPSLSSLPVDKTTLPVEPPMISSPPIIELPQPLFFFTKQSTDITEKGDCSLLQWPAIDSGSGVGAVMFAPLASASVFWMTNACCNKPRDKGGGVTHQLFDEMPQAMIILVFNPDGVWHSDPDAIGHCSAPSPRATRLCFSFFAHSQLFGCIAARPCSVFSCSAFFFLHLFVPCSDFYSHAPTRYSVILLCCCVDSFNSYRLGISGAVGIVMTWLFSSPPLALLEDVTAGLF